MARPGMPIGHWEVITELPESDIWSHLFNFMNHDKDSHWHFYYTHTFGLSLLMRNGKDNKEKTECWRLTKEGERGWLWTSSTKGHQEYTYGWTRWTAHCNEGKCTPRGDGLQRTSQQDDVRKDGSLCYLILERFQEVRSLFWIVCCQEVALIS